MKTQLIHAATALALCASLHQAAAQGTAFTYQGRLNDGGNAANGSYDLAFSLYTVDSGGSPAAGPLTNSATAVTNGLFTVTLDFGPNVFSGGAFWVDIAARTNGSGAFTELSPRQPLTASPYSIYSGLAAYATLADGVAGGVIGPNAFQVGAGPTAGQVLSYNGSLLAWTNVGGGGGSGWSLTGNSGTIPGTDFLGTSDNTPLELWVNGGRGWRLEPGNGRPNVVGGYGSSIDSSVTGGTIAGGVLNIISANGLSAAIGGGFQNTVSNLYPTISGGEYNTANANGAVIGGGYNNTASGREAVVSGGAQNLASGAGAFVGGGGYDGTTVAGNTAVSPAATVGGGLGNIAAGYYATVGGGFSNSVNNGYTFLGGGAYNSASGEYATIGGGHANSASGFSATVPGGAQNQASGDNSFAAGTFAQAFNTGAFVWADSQGSPFSSTANNQFSVRAGGGVRFVTGGAGMTIDGVPVGSGGGGLATNAWLLGGNYNANPALGNFLGTADSYPLELRVSGQRAMRLETSGSAPNQPNVIGGSALNSVVNSASGATIGGGLENTNGANYATISGGLRNTVTAGYATAGGGSGNTASGAYATVPGGQNNTALGVGSFAAGQSAQATYAGSFVWGDGTRFAVSQGSNTFSILATGGIYLYTTTAGTDVVLDNTGDMDFGSQTRQMLNLYGSSYGIGIQSSTLYQRTASGGGFAWYAGGVHNDGQDNPGGGATVMTLDGAGDLNVTANASVCSLTIRGGCDLAEPFQFSSAGNDIPQGAVVVIDEANPGHLKLSDEPYDARVAGVVSGANGIHPGIQMQQEGLIEGGKNVALTGRVYVQADTANGAIKAGDLLTTSSTPGRAMRVSDHARAQGAILGKAMTSLNAGQGMVLVLVTLQ